MADSVRLDVEDDFGPIDPDAEYRHELGYFLVLLLRGDKLGREIKRVIFAQSVLMLYMGIPMFVISCVANEKFDHTRYYSSNVAYGSPLLPLQFATSIFAILFGWLGLLCIHHWASLVSSRELFTKLSKGYQVALIFMFLFSLWQMSIFFKVFENADFVSTWIMQEIYIVYVATIIFMLPFIAGCLYYGLDLNYFQERVDEGEDISEPAPLPDHAMDLTGVNVTDLAGLALFLPALIIGQLVDGVLEVRDMIAKWWRTKMENRRRAAVQRKSFYRRVSKTFDRQIRKLFGCPKNHGWEMGYADPERISAEEEAEMRARQLEENAEQVRSERERQEEEEAARRRAEDEAAQQLMEAKFLNVLQFRDLWNTLPPAGSFQCKVTERPVMKRLVDHMATRGFHIVFASNTSENPEDTEHTSADFEMGICNLKGSDHAEFGRTWSSPSKNRAVGADSRAELASGLGQAAAVPDRHGTDVVHHWFLARFRCTPTAFSAVLKAEDPQAVPRFVKRFALAKCLRVDHSGGGGGGGGA